MLQERISKLALLTSVKEKRSRILVIQLIACLHDQNRLLSSQSKQFEKFSKSSDWLEKSHFSFDHVNKL